MAIFLKATETPPAPEATEAPPPPEATEVPDDRCNRPNHPVAASLAEGFGVDYDTIIRYHCDGFGFGEIARAFLLASETNEDVNVFYERRRQGEKYAGLRILR